MEEPLTEDELARFQEAFYDSKNLGDGSLTKERLIKIVEGLGESFDDATYSEIIQKVSNSKGTFDFERLLQTIASKIQMPTSKEDLQTAFNAFDKDKNGVITPSELRSVLTNLDQNLSNDEIDSLVSQLDTDGDGQIDYKEFVAHMTS
eukprot:m.39819 g.39819  ORF g.39819 m.39819 type:complete len:148 (-) comp16668_c0_seq3:68-511(-)